MWLKTFLYLILKKKKRSSLNNSHSLTPAAPLPLQKSQFQCQESATETESGAQMSAGPPHLHASPGTLAGCVQKLSWWVKGYPWLPGTPGTRGDSAGNQQTSLGLLGGRDLGLDSSARWIRLGTRILDGMDGTDGHHHHHHHHHPLQHRPWTLTLTRSACSHSHTLHTLTPLRPS